jgi:hypothetical protein
MTAAARLPARRLPANSQFDRPRAMGRIWLTRYLDDGALPPDNNWVENRAPWQNTRSSPSYSETPVAMLKPGHGYWRREAECCIA